MLFQFISWPLIRIMVVFSRQEATSVLDQSLGLKSVDQLRNDIPSLSASRLLRFPLHRFRVVEQPTSWIPWVLLF